MSNLVVKSPATPTLAPSRRHVTDGLGYGLEFNTIERARFSSFEYAGFAVVGCTLRNCCFSDVIMTDVTFDHCVFDYCSFRNSDFRNAVFIDCVFNRCSASNALTFQTELCPLFTEAEIVEGGCFGELELTAEELVLALGGKSALCMI